MAPDSTNRELLLPTEETVTVPPVAVRLAFCVSAVSINTLPKFNVDGVMVNCPLAAVVPAPVSGMLKDGPEI